MVEWRERSGDRALPFIRGVNVRTRLVRRFKRPLSSFKGDFVLLKCLLKVPPANVAIETKSNGRI